MKLECNTAACELKVVSKTSVASSNCTVGAYRVDESVRHHNNPHMKHKSENTYETNRPLIIQCMTVCVCVYRSKIVPKLN
jgi:hypothetical protein